MYHGTNLANATLIEEEVRFRPSLRGMLGPGVYVSRDIEKARCYGPVVFELLCDLGWVKKIDSIAHPTRSTWAAHSFDSAWVPPRCGMVPSGRTENCIADPDRITIVRRVRG